MGAIAGTIYDISQIKTGDNFGCSTDSFLGETIQDFEKCEVNHYGRFIWIYNQLYVFEAINKGISLTPFTYYTSQPEKYKLFVSAQLVPQGESQIELWVHYAISQITPSNYGYTNLLVAQPIKFIFGKWIGAHTLEQVEKRGFICGQFVAYLDQLTYNYYPDNTWIPLAPSDLFNSPNYRNFILQLPS